MSEFVFDNATFGPQLYRWLKFLIAPGSVILELGSGKGTGLLCQDYTVYSVEDDLDYVGLHPSTYIHAPREEGGWYDPAVLDGALPEHYDCLLIDGPRGSGYRQMILNHLCLFDIHNPVIFCDDVHRNTEAHVLASIAIASERRSIIVDDDKNKKFGIIR